MSSPNLTIRWRPEIPSHFGWRIGRSMSKPISKEPSLERAAFRSKGLKEGEDDVRVFFKDPYNVRGKDRLLCFVSEHTVRSKTPASMWFQKRWHISLQRYPFVVVYNDAKWNLEKRFSDFAQLDSELDEHFKSNESVQVRFVVCSILTIYNLDDQFLV